MSHIGQNIKKIRIIKNLSQQAFSELFNITRASVGAYEEGRAEPKIDTSIAIAKHFNLSLDQLMTKELTVNKLSNSKFNQFVEGSMFESIQLQLIDVNNAFKELSSNSKSKKSVQLPKLYFSGDILMEYRDAIQNSSNTNIISRDIIVGQLITQPNHGECYLIISEKSICINTYLKNENAETIFYVKITSIIKKNIQAINQVNIQNQLNILKNRLDKLEKN
jgi:transcriptional regulator with XRE-family HTH domain